MILTAGILTTGLLAGTTPASAATAPQPGTLDTSLGDNIAYTDSTLAVQPDGKILAERQPQARVGTTALVRLLPDGTLDTTFTTNQIHNSQVGNNATVSAITVDSQGRILVGGRFTSYTDTSTHQANTVMRLNADGTFDEAFGANSGGPSVGGATVDTVSLTADGKVLVSGGFTSYRDKAGLHRASNGLVRLNDDGTFDSTFNPRQQASSDRVGSSRVLSVQSDGKILFDSDRDTYLDGATHRIPGIVRLNADGTLDTSFNPAGTGPLYNGGRARASDAVVRDDGKIIVASHATSYNDGSDHPVGRIFQIGADGTFDASYNPDRLGPNGALYRIALGADGRLTMAGNFSEFDGRTTNNIARLNPDGTPDKTFNATGTGFAGSVADMALQPDGKVLLSTRSKSYNDGTDHPISGIIRINTASAPFLSGALPGGGVGLAYSGAVTATDQPASFEISSGALPDGLTMDAASGAISGTPSAAGDFTFEVTATNSIGATSKSFTISVAAPPTVNGELPAGKVGDKYSATIDASGTKPMSFAVTSGALPDGLTLDAASGAVTGTPTKAGGFTFAVTATNTVGTGVKAFTVTVTEAPKLDGDAPDGVVGVAYSGAMTATGTAPMTFAVTSGTLPDGVTLDGASGALSGTPTTAGDFTFEVSATNVAGSDVKSFTVTVTVLPALTGDFPAGKVGTRYEGNATATGTAPVSFSVTSGTLPDGVTLNPTTGAATGTPTKAGDFTFEITATNVAGSDTQSFTVPVAPADVLPVIDGKVPDGVVGAAYAGEVTATGTGPITFAVTSGALPDGVTLDTASGTLTGTPSKAGEFTFKVSATNIAGVDTKSFTMTVRAMPVIDGTLPDGLVGTAYSGAITATGTGPITFAVTSGALPDGVALNAASGKVSGTPTVAGEYTFTITATNSVGSGEKEFTVTVTQAPSITGELPDGVVGDDYSAQVTATGTGPIVFAVESGELPGGVTMDPATGNLTGKPTIAGEYTFEISATNAVGTHTKSFTITITQAPTLGGVLPDGKVGADYTGTITATGTTPITFAVTSAALPDGLTLDKNSGAVSGTPTMAGTFTFEVTGTNVAGTDVQSHTVTISDADVAPSLEGTLPDGIVGTSYSGTPTASGTGPITFAITGGALPDGLSLDGTTGVISGTPTVAGASTITLTATNVAGSFSFDYTITVIEAPTLTGTLPDGVVGTSYAGGVTASGTAPITFTVASGTLPDGITLDAATGALTGAPTAAGVFSFSVTATNSAGADTKPYVITVSAPPMLTGAGTLPAGTVSVPYQGDVIADGTGPITLTVTAGSVPDGLALAQTPNDANRLAASSAATAILSGTPTVAGEFTFTVTASNAWGTDTKEYTVTIADAEMPTLDGALPVAHVGAPYTATPTVTGTGPITFAVSDGKLPAGLTLDPATGTVSGTPIAAGEFNFTISATNVAGTDEHEFSITVIATPTAVAPHPAAPGTIAATGFNVGPLLAMGILALVLGVAVTLRHRHRRSRDV